MGSNNFTCKLPIADSECLCILNSEWSDESIQLLLLHNGQAWSGKFQFKEDEDLSELIDQFSLTEEQYKEETKKALTTQGGAENFGYTIENDKLTWKKYVSANMAIKFGYVALSKVPAFEIFEKIIDKDIQSNLTINEKLLNCDKQKDILEKENTDLKLILSDLIELKDEMEKTLYSKFLVLLNEKKKKIQNLKRKLNCNDEEEEYAPDFQQNDIDNFSAETEIDTDDECKPSPSKVQVVGSISNVEENIYVIPKKSSMSVKNESIASSSGVSKIASKSKMQNFTDESVSRTKDKWLRGVKLKLKLTKDSCVMGKRTDEKGTNNSEEDVFMFPKRYKNVVNKPPISRKITFDESDDDDKICMEGAEETETDSDSTPEQMSPVKDVTVRVEQTEVIDKRNSSEEETILNIKDEPPEENNEVTKDSRCEEFSKSTLEMLNKLI